MSERSGHRHVVIGVITLVAIFGGFVLVVSGWIRAPFQPSTREATAVLANTATLAKDSPVRIRGVEEGKVTGVELNADGRTASVRMTLRKSAPELHRDATAALRWRLVLGGNYVVEIDPGSPRAERLGGAVIPEARTSSQVELDEVLSVLRDKQRTGIRTLLAELPRAFADTQGLSRALQTTADVAPRLARTVASVRGERPDRDLRDLISSAASTVRALDRPSDGIRDVVEGGAATLETTARRGGDIERTIDVAAAALPRIRTTLDSLDHTLVVADPALHGLRRTAGDVAPTAAALRPTVSEADKLLIRARPLVRRLRPAAVALRRAARDGRPLLNGLAPSLRRLDERILPDLALPDATSKRPTFQMIGPTLASFASVAGNFDAISHYVALDAAAGDPKVDTAGCSTYFSDLKPGQALTCESLLNALGRLLSPPGRRR